MNFPQKDIFTHRHQQKDAVTWLESMKSGVICNKNTHGQRH